MASTVPAKSQPLHNFTLPHLKWNNDRSSSGGHHQRRRSVKSPSRRPNISSASPVRQSPLRDSVSATPPRHQSPLPHTVASAASPSGSPVHGDFVGKRSPTPGESSKAHLAREWGKHSPTGGDSLWHLSRHDLAPESETSGGGKGGSSVEHRKNHSKNPTSESVRNGLHPAISERSKHKSESKSKAKEAGVSGIKRSKILIKLPYKSSKADDESPVEEPPKVDNNGEDGCSGEVQEDEKINNNNTDEEMKTWNLRPRKPIRKSLNVNGVTVRNNGTAAPERSKTQSPLRNLNNRSGENDGGNGGKKEKRKLSIFVSLTKEEIEEDIFALTGSKPARRPKKRAKNVQKQVDIVFPGLWLVSINADSYKVSENSLKG